MYLIVLTEGKQTNYTVDPKQHCFQNLLIKIGAVIKTCWQNALIEQSLILCEVIEYLKFSEDPLYNKLSSYTYTSYNSWLGHTLYNPLCNVKSDSVELYDS